MTVDIAGNDEEDEADAGEIGAEDRWVAGGVVTSGVRGEGTESGGD